MIYFAQPKNGGPIRIGSSKNVDARRRTLGTWLPGGVEVVLEIEGSLLGEAVLHNCFNPIRIDRDWFMSCAPIWKFILGALEARPAWVPEQMGDAPRYDLPALVEEFGGRDKCFSALGYNSFLTFEQAVRYQSRDGFGISARVIFHRLLRDDLLPAFIAELHRQTLQVAA
ncbi:GIY-YIG nuclease family protein [Rhizobium leguminosarum]|uniref:GIY-YIG nuclease family protein n=1 Tax=Rhizobium leguminosarum TaxID=384 RepID=UPI000490D56B|nr:GIY-YIG nuclease family protein [Rhizobium leguminosarum]